MGTTVEQISGFMEFLRQHRDDRGIMADLRHGFSPGAEYRAWPHLAPWCNLADDCQRTIWQTIAAGFATHRQSVVSGNLGVTLRKLALDGAAGNKEEALKSFDARFRRLLACDTAAEVCQRLVPIIRAAERKGIPLDFEKLFFDLWQWELPSAKIKIKWAATYWGANYATDNLEEGVRAQ